MHNTTTSIFESGTVQVLVLGSGTVQVLCMRHRHRFLDEDSTSLSSFAGVIN